MDQPLETVKQTQFSATALPITTTHGKLPFVLHLRSNFEDNPNHQEQHNILVRNTGIRRHRVRCWREFTEILKEELPNLITVHCNELSISDQQNPEQFINFINGLVNYIGSTRNSGTISIPIAIGITPACDQAFVNRLKQVSGVIGVYQAMDTLNKTTQDERTRAHLEFLAGRKYWPEHVINQLPNLPQRPLSIYFREDWRTYITPAMLENMKNSRFDVAYCADWNELDSAIKKNPHQLIFHINMLDRLHTSVPELVSMIDTRLKLAGLDIPIAVGIDPTVTQATIKELKRAGVFGLCFSAAHWGLEEITRGMTSLADRVPYWPRHLIDQLPGRQLAVKKTTPGTVTLTTRQQEVMDLICRRGLSNKQIAKNLNLSESTVKIHVSAVMRAHGVRNRTQLALSAGAGLKA